MTTNPDELATTGVRCDPSRVLTFLACYRDSLRYLWDTAREAGDSAPPPEHEPIALLSSERVILRMIAAGHGIPLGQTVIETCERLQIDRTTRAVSAYLAGL